jgi:AdoMet-dependent heme synthase
VCDLFEKMIYKPLSIQFEITESCTHKCRHCYNYYSDNRSSASTNRDVINKIAEQEFFDITLTGGEPLSARPQLYEAIKIFKRENMDVRINSNLHLLKDYDAEKFAEFKVNSILSSILGSNEKTHDSLTGVRGSFKRLGESIRYLSKNNLRVAMNMVVNKNNLQEVYGTGKFLFENFGIDYFAATPMTISPGKDLTDITLSREEYILTLDNLLKLEDSLGIKTDSLNPAIPCMFPEGDQEKYRKFFENRACGAGKGTLTFSIEGEVRPCSQERRSYGNIVNNSLEKILIEMNDWREGKNIPQECSPCEYVDLCKGGCRVSAEASSGKLNGLEPYFVNPVKKKISPKENKLIDFKKLKTQRGNIRMRDEENGLTTLYLSPKINGILTPTELNIFRRFLSGSNYNNILKEVKNEEILREICTKLSDRKLLVDISA